MTATAPAAPAKVYFTNLRTHARESQLDKLKPLTDVDRLHVLNKLFGVEAGRPASTARDGDGVAVAVMATGAVAGKADAVMVCSPCGSRETPAPAGRAAGRPPSRLA